MDHDPLIQRAIDHCGSQPKLATAVGCVQQTISKLLKRQMRVTAELAMSIERATDGAVTAREIRPDLPWPVLAPARDERVTA
jgi:DNA-binding transcriptional regulator YdaS (Cro superfamily)